EATGPYGAHVTGYTATASDPISGVVLTYSRPLGSVFPLGSTTVTATATATDGSHNSSTATFTVTVLPAPGPPPGHPGHFEG
ncbi:MAG: HYR domain-containing protein, partial [Gaiellaceae bacterium]